MEVDGKHFPVKQAFEIAAGLHRATVTSQRALSVFERLGFETSATNVDLSGDRRPRHVSPAPPVTVEEAGRSFTQLVSFLRDSSLTAGISSLESRLVNADSTSCGEVAASAGLSNELLKAALVVRRDVGRVSDVIHACVIALALPRILEQGEFIAKRPSLGPGNDPTRPYDLETNVRVAEFKVAVWSGGDVMRKRGVVADLVHLALDTSSRRPELWLAGAEPLHFLRTSASSMEGLLSRASRHLRERFRNNFGSAEMPLKDFIQQHASHVRIHNLADTLPEVAAALRG